MFTPTDLIATFVVLFVAAFGLLVVRSHALR